jgi:hypothetical protein
MKSFYLLLIKVELEYSVKFCENYSGRLFFLFEVSEIELRSHMIKDGNILYYDSLFKQEAVIVILIFSLDFLEDE